MEILHKTITHVPLQHLAGKPYCHQVEANYCICNTGRRPLIYDISFVGLIQRFKHFYFTKSSHKNILIDMFLHLREIKTFRTQWKEVSGYLKQHGKFLRHM